MARRLILSSSNVRRTGASRTISLPSSTSRQSYSSLSTFSHPVLTSSNRDKKEDDSSRYHRAIPRRISLVSSTTCIPLGSGGQQQQPLFPYSDPVMRCWYSTSRTTTTRSSSISTRTPPSDGTSDNNVEKEEEEHKPKLQEKMQQRATAAREKMHRGAEMAQEKMHEAQEKMHRGAEVAHEKMERGAKVAKKGAKTGMELMKQYGPVFVGTYASVYFLTLGALFAGIDSGLMDPVTVLSYVKPSEGETAKSTVEFVVNLMEQYDFTKQYVPYIERNPHAANLAVAWIAVKFTEPIRLVTTIAIVPRLARWLGRVPPKETTQEESDEKENATGMENEKTSAASDDGVTKKDLSSASDKTLYK